MVSPEEILKSRDAQLTAKALLVRFLLPHQQHELKAGCPYFSCKGSHSKSIYRVYCLPGVSINVVEPETYIFYCTNCRGIPFFDTLLVKKLLIENDEYMFLHKSNSILVPREHYQEWAASCFVAANPMRKSNSSIPWELLNERIS